MHGHRRLQGPAEDLARMAANGDPAILGIGISVQAEPGSGTGNGQIGVALSDPFPLSEQFAMRSSFSEGQRRSMMAAADVVHRALSSKH